MARFESECPQFGIDFQYQADATRLSLHGELDALSVPAFSGVLNSLVERGVRTVTIDLSGLRFCNIGGLRAMAELAARLHAVDGRVAIFAPSILTRMLELSDLHSLFDVEDSPATRPDPMESSSGRSPRTVRPRAGSLHRLSTGAA
ncbi:MAG TPA: STAS domain-containing protein [Acidimicrobiia bacterium]|nr:STAS domain-containing protein [Acidimicrobiia bacterium]